MVGVALMFASITKIELVSSKRMNGVAFAPHAMVQMNIIAFFRFFIMLLKLSQNTYYISLIRKLGYEY